MANRDRGEVDLAAGEKTYTLVLTTNGACALESAAGRPVDDIVQGAIGRVVGGKRAGSSVVDMRWLIWASLQERHGDTVKTPQDAGLVIDEAGGLGIVWATMNGFVQANADTSTDRKKDEGSKDEADPLIAQAEASGNASTSTRAASV